MLQRKNGFRSAGAVGTLLCALALWLVPAHSRAQDADAAKGSSESPATARTAKPIKDTADLAALRSAARAYQEAVERGDLEAVSEFWTDGADYVDRAGQSYEISERLEHAKKRAAAGHPLAGRSKSLHIRSFRFVTRDVAIEDGSFDASDGNSDGLPTGHYTAVWVKRNGKWLIDGVREAEPRQTDGAVQLKPLAWMVGDWTAETDEGAVEIACHWGPGRNYLLRTLSIQPRGGVAFTATQWIGWDPKQHHIRSFAYDSRGGYGQGTWQREGDSWSVTTQGVLPDGRKSSGTNLYTPEGADALLWESIDEEIDGAPAEEVRMHLKRKPAAE